MLSKNTVSKQEMSKTKGGGGGRRGRLSQGSQQASFRDLCGQGGVQIGNTKVFFRQVRWCEVDGHRVKSLFFQMSRR